MDFSTITAITIPEGEVTKVEQADGTVLWEINGEDTTDYFRFTSVNDAEFTVAHNGGQYDPDGDYNCTVEYSLNKKSWVTWNDGTAVTVPAGNGPFYMRCTNVAHLGDDATTAYFTLTGDNVKVGGNIETLLDYKTTQAGSFVAASFSTVFAALFANCTTLVDASELNIPRTTAPNMWYQAMFYSCTNLVTPPALPATTLDRYCYYSMFYNCRNLTTAPSLPAITLATYCYNRMFWNCTSLTAAPELPATTLASNCYGYMFNGCTGLTAMPELPATTLADYCYSNMFSSCTRLTSIVPLRATTLANGCYSNMFSRCTNITTLPALTATSLSNYAYQYMFEFCTNIKLAETQDDVYINEYKIPYSGTSTIYANTSLNRMFYFTGGTFTNTPSINTTYYTSNTIIE